MRATTVVLAAVLGSIVAGTGCCKTCDWCNWGSRSSDKPVPAVSSPPVVVSTDGKSAAGAPTIPVAPPAQTAAPGGTGAYGGTGN
jgi:hypothetical protein